MEHRIKRIFSKIESPVEALVLANSIEPHLDGSFFYVFDTPSGLFEGSVAIARPDGALDLITTPLEAESAHQAAAKDRRVAIHVAESPSQRDKLLAQLIPTGGPLALNFRELTHEMFLQLAKLRPETEWVDASVPIRNARVVKDPAEIGRLEEAARIASKVADEIPSVLRSGITELELAAELEHRMNRYGASGRSFATIVGFDVKGAEPHYEPQDRPLKPGSSIVCDFGALHKRYASDITRSFRFGPSDPEMKHVHETVFAAQKAALGVIRAGLPAKEAHLAAQKVIDASPFKGRFTHGLGHSIGLAVHDGFGCGPMVEDPLEAGMAITVEPGIYLPGKGGVRIEDDIVVTDSGYRFLTTAHREYLEVAA